MEDSDKEISMWKEFNELDPSQKWIRNIQEKIFDATRAISELNYEIKKSRDECRKGMDPGRDRKDCEERFEKWKYVVDSVGRSSEITKSHGFYDDGSYTKVRLKITIGY